MKIGAIAQVTVQSRWIIFVRSAVIFPLGELKVYCQVDFAQMIIGVQNEIR